MVWGKLTVDCWPAGLALRQCSEGIVAFTILGMCGVGVVVHLSISRMHVYCSYGGRRVRRNNTSSVPILRSDHTDNTYEPHNSAGAWSLLNPPYFVLHTQD